VATWLALANVKKETEGFLIAAEVKNYCHQSKKQTRNRKHRRAAAKPAACAPNAVNTREQGKEGGKVR